MINSNKNGCIPATLQKEHDILLFLFDVGVKIVKVLYIFYALKGRGRGLFFKPTQAD